MKMHRVLIFPAGSEIGLEIFRSLIDQKNIEVFGGTSVNDHSELTYENLIPNIPNVDSPFFFQHIKKICDDFKIDLIFPANDSVVVELLKRQNELTAIVIGPSYDTARILRSKRETYEALHHKVSCPQEISFDEAISRQNFPYFLKPAVGQGSKGATRLETMNHLMFYHQLLADPMILEYLPGNEYTVDCFTSKNGELLFCEGRIRSRILNGISVRTEFVQNKNFKDMAEQISQVFCFNGPWFFQVKEAKNGELKLLEVSPRISGTSGFFRALGVNLPLLSIHNIIYEKLAVNISKFNIVMDRSLAPCFLVNIQFDNLYVDLDDTLIINEKVNLRVIKFIFQCRNNGKKIYLITKHKFDLNETLKKFRLSEVFDSVIHLDPMDKKHQHMLSSSLLVDDSFKERIEAQEHGFFAVSFDTVDNIKFKDV